jgi:hypothetical protein
MAEAAATADWAAAPAEVARARLGGGAAGASQGALGGGAGIANDGGGSAAVRHRSSGGTEPSVPEKLARTNAITHASATNAMPNPDRDQRRSHEVRVDVVERSLEVGGVARERVGAEAASAAPAHALKRPAAEVADEREGDAATNVRTPPNHRWWAAFPSTSVP